jgi:hypothetical protein
VVSDDVGSRQVPGIGAIDGAPGITKGPLSPDGTVRIRVSIDVDDERYELAGKRASAGKGSIALSNGGWVSLAALNAHSNPAARAKARAGNRA